MHAFNPPWSGPAYRWLATDARRPTRPGPLPRRTADNPALPPEDLELPD